jgi:hypothetical protein
MTRRVPADVVAKVAALYEGADAEFFHRVWGGGLDRYDERLRALGFEGHGRVLDCGFGMAQWMVALADMNTHVSGLEYSPRRVAGARAL